MKQSWGALHEDWDAFSRIAAGDIWPCVSNPSIPRALSKLDVDNSPVGKDFAKVPSGINNDGEAHRYSGWTTLTSTQMQLNAWRAIPDLSFGVVGRKLKGIDIDIDDKATADSIDDLIYDIVGARLPARMRGNTGRRMLIYRLPTSDRIRKKQVVKTASGAVEFLFDKQFFVLAGVHHSGARHTWPDGYPSSLEDVPELTNEQLDHIIGAIGEQYGTDDSPTGVAYHLEPLRPRDSMDADVLEVDRVVEVLQNAGLFKQFLDGGKIAVCCPWQDQHASTNGEPDLNPTKTVLFPPGVGGFTQWGFKCMHTEGHGTKTFDQFADAVGIVPSEFTVVSDADDDSWTRPKFLGVRKTGEVPATPANLYAAIAWPGLGVHVYLDKFLANIMISFDKETKARPLDDTDYFNIQLRLCERVAIPKASTQFVREAVAYLANEKYRDMAIEWGRSLVWDGVDRISDFHTKVLGTEDTYYNKAVVEYMFTALAGRCMDPGVKADMVPVLVGRQGTRKSTLVKTLAPFSEAYLPINLATRDEDLSRSLRGKLLVEAEELRGIGSRDADSIKAWISRDTETWIPKYRENSTEYKRRFLIIGTTNNERFLSDPTGSRRWLPIKVCKTRASINTDFVAANCEALWAQAINMFQTKGVLWRQAEFLAVNEITHYTKFTPREIAVKSWVEAKSTDGFTTTEIMIGALGIGLSSSSANAASIEIERIMTRLGYEIGNNGGWYLDMI